MTMLDAKALDNDPEGLAFLRSVLRPDAPPARRPDWRRPAGLEQEPIVTTIGDLGEPTTDPTPPGDDPKPSAVLLHSA